MLTFVRFVLGYCRLIEKNFSLQPIKIDFSFPNPLFNKLDNTIKLNTNCLYNWYMLH